VTGPAHPEEPAADDQAEQAGPPERTDAPGTPEEATGPDASGTQTPVFCVVQVSSVAFPMPSPSPTINLRELDEPYRGMEFPIGLAEAQSIAMALDAISPPRPGPHDLLGSVLAASGTDVVAVRITAAHAGTLLAEMDLMTPRGRVVLDCRPTDGIAVALRQVPVAPILVEDSLLTD
jgi:bifunctional DNase/RNase